MKAEDFARSEMDASAAVIAAMRTDHELIAALVRVADRCAAAIKSGNKIMFCGNGGSAADAQHLAAELVGKLVFPRPAMAGLSLTTDTSALTAIGNDFGYEHVFSRQVEGLGRAGDVLIGLSTSGRSANVVNAMKASRERSIATIAMTGSTPGPMADLADEWLAVPQVETPRIQEAHIVLGHVFCSLIEAKTHSRHS